MKLFLSQMEFLNSEKKELQELAEDTSAGEEMQQLAKDDIKDITERLQSLEKQVSELHCSGISMGQIV